MKKLQNNFTTPEQSKRLLELGVPADSADCVYEPKQVGTKMIMSSTPDIIPNTIKLSWNDKRIPCWSVGRLIEIMALSYKFVVPYNSSIQLYTIDIKKGIVVDVLISDIERFINKIDLSKLED